MEPAFPKVLNPEAIGNPDMTPIIQIPKEMADLFKSADTESTEPPEWLLDVCKRENYSDVPIHRPFLIQDGNDAWMVATNGVRLIALKNKTGYGISQDPGFDKVILNLLRPDGEWRPVDLDVFGAFFADANDRACRLGRIGDATIDRGLVSDVMHHLDWREMEYQATDARSPVYFRGNGWLMCVMPLDPDTLEIPCFERPKRSEEGAVA